MTCFAFPLLAGSAAAKTLASGLANGAMVTPRQAWAICSMNCRRDGSSNERRRSRSNISTADRNVCPTLLNEQEFSRIEQRPDHIATAGEVVRGDLVHG